MMITNFKFLVTIEMNLGIIERRSVKIEKFHTKCSFISSHIISSRQFLLIQISNCTTIKKDIALFNLLK